MTAKEIINKGKVAVRNSSTLYPIYQNLFKEAFGYFPECPTCGSVNGHKHWEAFVAFGNGSDPATLLTQNNITMSNKTFEIKNKNIIYSYNFKKKGQDRLFTSRSYGDVMSEEFAIAYLDNAAGEEDILNERKSQFSILPMKYRTDKDKNGENASAEKDLSKLKLVDLQSIATEKQYPLEEWEKINSKANLIAYLEAKELNSSENSDSEGSDDENSDNDLV